MAFSAATLATQLALIGGATEEDAIDDWCDAWATYFAGAVTSNGVAITTNPTAIANAKAAMADAMVGLSEAGQDAIEAGISQWWEYLKTNASTFFTGGSAMVVPTDLLTIAADMEDDVFTANLLETTTPPAMTRMANYLHTKNTGGTVTIGGTPRTIA